MAKKIKSNRCNVCGYEMVGFMGRCPECGSFGSFEPIEKDENFSKKNSGVKLDCIDLNKVKSQNSERVITGINEFDRVMGSGIVKDSVTILTARPGAGKSTLLLQVSNALAKKGYSVLYASGEESASQIKSRADRILPVIEDNLKVVSHNNMDSILDTIRDLDAQFIIIDSIQAFTLDAFPTSRAGSPTQTMECAYELVKLAKNKENPKMIFIVGQMTKEDELAGLRALEHLVDTVLLIEGESGEELRSLLTTKNRYGSTGEMGFFNMTEEGMISIDNPSEYFMTKRSREQTVSGSSLTVVREGTRPILLEIESLVSPSFTPFPSRIGEAMKREQLNTLVSILEQRGEIPLYDKNIVIKTTGGIKLKEQASNLAVITSIVSSIYDKPLPDDTIFLADVGLTGELKRIPALETRLREADRMGIKTAYISESQDIKIKLNSLQLVKKRLLKDVLKTVF
ncbi:MAG: DNA repair protein RadA [Gudongella sp.]|nr:DNA repair protein RadA [Gudongella sp.]